jgi:hypothetical protein
MEQTELKRSSSEKIAIRMSRGLATRWSRRSLLGRFGAGVVAVSVGAEGLRLLVPAVAEAVSCPPGCDCSESVMCHHIYGFNHCPGTACSPNCGCWTVSNCSACPSSPSCHQMICDCCGGCNNGADCRCIADVGHPSCCNKKHWPGGCGDFTEYIDCRMTMCA